MGEGRYLQKFIQHEKMHRTHQVMFWILALMFKDYSLIIHCFHYFQNLTKWQLNLPESRVFVKVIPFLAIAYRPWVLKILWSFCAITRHSRNCRKRYQQNTKIFNEWLYWRFGVLNSYVAFNWVYCIVPLILCTPSPLYFNDIVIQLIEYISA